MSITNHFYNLLGLINDEGEGHLVRIINEPEQRITIEQNRQKKQRRYRVSAIITGSDINGNQMGHNPYECNWYINYVLYPQTQEPTFQKSFKNRFRITYSMFLKLTEELEGCDEFSRWHSGKKSVDGRRAAPLSLLVLVVMRYLGQAETMDSLAMQAQVGGEVVRNFVHIFLEYGSDILYKRYIKAPSTKEEALTHMHEYTCAGFPGAIASTDATSIELKKVPQSAKNAHLGFKSSKTARTYNVTVNHRRKILSTTTGHPATWNDMSICMYDEFLNGLQNGSILNELEYHLYGYDDDKNIVKRLYNGCWLLVDNGYFARSTLIPPIKPNENTSLKAQRFSKWLESLRKDVECTFGILKQRWKILDYGIRLHGTEKPDEVFMTCCAFHNWILEETTTDIQWEHSITIPAALERTNEFMDPNTPIGRLYELQNQNDNVNNENLNPNNGIVQAAPPINILSLDRKTFRNALIDHFDIAFARGEVAWPVSKKMNFQNAIDFENSVNM
jgi:hypothetical protein